MDALIIDQTEFSPKVVLDPGNKRFEFSGESRPENAGKFYEPVVKWLEVFYKELNTLKTSGGTTYPITINFSLDYFNSTSAKHLLDVLKQLDLIKKAQIDVVIKWHYHEMDEDMKESGEEFSKLIEVPFEFVLRQE